MQKKLVARFPVTGLYFDGTGFNAKTPIEALELRPGTTAHDFRYSWNGTIEVIEVVTKKSLAEMIYSGELDKYQAARRYVIEQRRTGQRSFSIRTANGKYISRNIQIEKTGPSPVAWVKFCGSECALVWSRGELALDGVA